MKKTNQPLTAPDAASSKAKLFFTAMALAALMVTAAGGGAALMIYRSFAAMPAAPQASVSRGLEAARLAGVEPMPRSENYRTVDNTVLPPAAARRVIAAWRSNPVVSNVPPPLMKTPAEEAVETTNRPPLADPESRYIVSAHTGKVLGVDGSASVQREEAVPVAVAAQLPPREIRIASAVQVRAALPVEPTDADASFSQDTAPASDAQSVPVRRAAPVATGRNFNAASYLASGDNLTVIQGQVVNPTSRAAGYSRDFSLPDRSSR